MGVMNTFDDQSEFGKKGFQRSLGVNADMASFDIMVAIGQDPAYLFRQKTGNAYDQTAFRFQYAHHFAYCTTMIGNMLQYLGTDQNIENIIREGQLGDIRDDKLRNGGGIDGSESSFPDVLETDIRSHHHPAAEPYRRIDMPPGTTPDIQDPVVFPNGQSFKIDGDHGSFPDMLRRFFRRLFPM